MSTKDKEKDNISADLKKSLFYTKKTVLETANENLKQSITDFCEDYKHFISTAKTERLVVDKAVDIAKQNGFVEYTYDNRRTLKSGDKIYLIHRNKAVILAVIGSDPLDCGINLTIAHGDSPRLDLKGNPVFEDADMAFLQTHYYGGIKKYQWLSSPLALYGVIIKSDGTKAEINIGDNENDPVLCISDLLPHLSKDYMSKTAAEFVSGEALNVFISSTPFTEDGEKTSDAVKLFILDLLNKKYNITERDFMSADLSLVPAGKARDVGLDKSMIGGYGQDDRVCVYTELIALMEITAPKRTCVTAIADREEIGSSGNTGMNSRFLTSFIEELSENANVKLRDVLRNSRCLSADVNAAFDPNYPNVLEKNNASYAGSGVVVTKYTGVRGKSETSEASAEFLSYVFNLFDKNKITWQTGMLGKIDAGGGGTVAKYVAEMDIEVVDVGVPVLGMHSLFELTAKTDVYMAYKAFKAFNESL